MSPRRRDGALREETMRIRNKELRARRQRKEERVKDIIRDLKAGKGKVDNAKAAPVAEAVAEAKPKAPAKPKSDAKPKAPAKPKVQAKAKDDKPKAAAKAPAKAKSKKADSE